MPGGLSAACKFDRLRNFTSCFRGDRTTLDPPGRDRRTSLNQTVVALIPDPDCSRFIQFECKERDDIFRHELGSDGATDQQRKLVLTQGNILFDLNRAQCVRTAFDLDWERVVSSLFVQPYIDFIGFYLSSARYRSTQMILQGVARDARENVQHPVIAQLREERLLIVQGHDARRSIGDWGNRQTAMLARSM